MMNRRHTATATANATHREADISRAWYATPVLAAAFAAAVLMLPRGIGLSEAVAAQPVLEEPTASLMAAIMPSPQPGEGEPALDPFKLPQSY